MIGNGKIVVMPSCIDEGLVSHSFLEYGMGVTG